MVFLQYITDLKKKNSCPSKTQTLALQHIKQKSVVMFAWGGRYEAEVNVSNCE